MCKLFYLLLTFHEKIISIDSSLIFLEIKKENGRRNVTENGNNRLPDLLHAGCISQLGRHWQVKNQLGFY